MSRAGPRPMSTTRKESRERSRRAIAASALAKTGGSHEAAAKKHEAAAKKHEAAAAAHREAAAGLGPKQRAAHDATVRAHEQVARAHRAEHAAQQSPRR